MRRIEYQNPEAIPVARDGADGGAGLQGERPGNGNGRRAVDSRHFLTDGDLRHMPLGAVMRASVCLSGLPEAAVIASMGWSERVGWRILNPADDYWPGVPSLPRLVGVLGNDLLLRWLSARSAEVSAPERGPLSPEALLGELGALFAACGAVGARGKAALADGLIEAREARQIRRSVEALLRDGARLLEALSVMERCDTGEEGRHG